MNHRSKGRALAGILIAGLTSIATGAQAGSLNLVYVGDNPLNDQGELTAVVGDILTFEVQLDIGDQLVLGGGFDTSFTTDTLGFVQYVDAGVGDPMFGREPDVMDGLLFSAAVGAFEGIGSGLIATIRFEVTAPGLLLLDLEDSGGIGPTWISADDFVSVVVTNFGSVRGVATVPLPGAAWFLLSGLAALGWTGARLRGTA